MLSWCRLSTSSWFSLKIERGSSPTWSRTRRRSRELGRWLSQLSPIKRFTITQWKTLRTSRSNFEKLRSKRWTMRMRFDSRSSNKKIKWELCRVSIKLWASIWRREARRWDSKSSRRGSLKDRFLLLTIPKFMLHPVTRLKGQVSNSGL